MGSSSDRIQIHLTPEQQELLRQMCGQVAEVLELAPEAADPSGGGGRGLQFRWNLPTTPDVPSQEEGQGSGSDSAVGG